MHMLLVIVTGVLQLAVFVLLGKLWGADAASMATGAARMTRHRPLFSTSVTGGADFHAGSSGRMTTSMIPAATRKGRGP